MRIVVARDTSLPSDKLYAWWTAFRDGDHDHEFLRRWGRRHGGPVRRRVLSRHGDRVEIEDVGAFLWIPLVEHYTAHLRRETREVELSGANNLGRFSAVYRFPPGRVELEAHVAPMGLLAFLDVLGRPLVKWFLTRDLEGHLEDAELDLLPPKPVSAPPEADGA